MRYALGMVAGGLSGALAAPLGAVVALGIAATSDLSGLTLLLSLGGVLGVLPLVMLIGLVLGMLIGAVTAALGGR